MYVRIRYDEHMLNVVQRSNETERMYVCIITIKIILRIVEYYLRDDCLLLLIDRVSTSISDDVTKTNCSVISASYDHVSVPHHAAPTDGLWV